MRIVENSCEALILWDGFHDKPRVVLRCTGEAEYCLVASLDNPI